jgi:hypothetical protein
MGGPAAPAPPDYVDRHVHHVLNRRSDPRPPRVRRRRGAAAGRGEAAGRGQRPAAAGFLPTCNHARAGVPRRPVRRRPGLRPLSRGIRRPRGGPVPATGGVHGPAPSRGAERGGPQPHRVRDGGTDRPDHGIRRSAAPVSPAPVHVGGDLVPDVLGAGSRLRRGQPGDPGRPGRRGVDRQRSEGLDHSGSHRSIRDAPGPHRPGSREAQRSHLLRRRHAGPRR